ncbi:MAG: hypothetical protein KDA57_21690 [Planctomycetales bacterium]|nr:hypothetical protein [Planctomycetales bacterium]
MKDRLIFTLALIVASLAFNETCFSQPQPQRLQSPAELMLEKMSAGVLLKMIRVPSIRSELALEDNQKKLVKSLLDRTNDQMHLEFLRSTRDPINRALIQEQIAAIANDADEELKRILNREQVKKLQTALVRARLRASGIAALLASDEMRELLSLNDGQVEAIQTKTPEVLKRMQEQIQQLKRNALAEILAPLAPEQKAALLDVIGDGELHLHAPADYEANTDADLSK